MIEHLQVKITQKALITIENKLLLVLEGPTWELPGGRVDNNESNLEEALKRELREELSLDINIKSIYTTYLFTKPTGEIGLAIIYKCDLVSSIDSLKTQLGEIDSWKLFDTQELQKLKNIYPNSLQAIEKLIS